MYYWIYNLKIDPWLKMNLLGVIAFSRSAWKHLRRGNRAWMVVDQLRGILMCVKQMVSVAQRKG